MPEGWAEDKFVPLWVKRVLPACAVLNTTPRHATKVSPIEMETGRRPRTSLGMAAEFDAVTPVSAAEAFVAVSVGETAHYAIGNRFKIRCTFRNKTNTPKLSGNAKLGRLPWARKISYKMYA